MNHFGFGGFVSAVAYQWDQYRDWHLWDMLKYETSKGRGTQYVWFNYTLQNRRKDRIGMS